MAQNADSLIRCTQTPHIWPESIDVDQAGNLYFTDAVEGTLYRIARNSDQTLKAEEKLLITGLRKRRY